MTTMVGGQPEQEAAKKSHGAKGKEAAPAHLQEDQHNKKDSVPEISTWKEGTQKANNSKTDTEYPIVADIDYKPKNPIIAENK